LGHKCHEKPLNEELRKKKKFKKKFVLKDPVRSLQVVRK